MGSGKTWLQNGMAVTEKTMMAAATHGWSDDEGVAAEMQPCGWLTTGRRTKLSHTYSSEDISALKRIWCLSIWWPDLLLIWTLP